MNGAPASQDKPTNIPMLDEVLALAPALEVNWPAERATIPPGTLLNDGTEAEIPGGGGEEGEPEGDPSGGGQSPEGEESFFDFDPSLIPEDKDPLEWVGEQYGSMRKAFTQKTMGIAETRREAEQSQALIDGLRDPQTMPHYLGLLGIDLADPQTLEALGVPGVSKADQELLDLLDDEGETSLEDRLAAIEKEREKEGQERQQSKVEQALDELADNELEKIESEWGRELNEDEDYFVRKIAEENPGPDGLPDYAAGAKALKSWLGRLEKEFAKKRSEPGRGAPGGKPGGRALDPNKEEDRIKLAEAAAERAMASQE